MPCSHKPSYQCIVCALLLEGSSSFICLVITPYPSRLTSDDFFFGTFLYEPCIFSEWVGRLCYSLLHSPWTQYYVSLFALCLGFLSLTKTIFLSTVSSFVCMCGVHNAYSRNLYWMIRNMEKYFYCVEGEWKHPVSLQNQASVLISKDKIQKNTGI